MKTRGWLYFFYGCISGLFVAFTTIFIIQYAGNLSLFAGLHSSRDISRLQSRTLTKPNLVATSADSEKGLEEKRYLYLYVVISSIKDLGNSYKSVSLSWGSMTADWKIGVSGLSYNGSVYKNEVDFSEHLLLTDNCEDFSSHNISSIDMFCLIHSIYTSLSDYKWFVIAPSNSYLAVHSLSNILAPLDPNIPHYFGKSPITCDERKGKLCHSYCALEHSIVLSQAALLEVASQLSPCFYTAKAKESSGDKTLGWCLKKSLSLSCSDLLLKSQINSSELFPSYSPTFPLQKYFVSISSIPNYKAMINIQAYVFSIDVQAHVKLAIEFAMLAYKTCQRQGRTNGCYSFLNTKPLLDLFSYSTPTSNHHLPQYLSTAKWETVVGNIIYDSDKLEKSRKLSDEELAILGMVVIKSLDHTGDNLGGMSLDYVSLAYCRYHSYKSVEAVLNLDMDKDDQKITLRSSISLPLFSGDMEIEVVSVSRADKRTLEFLVPVSNAKQELSKFLEMLKEACFGFEEKCNLNLVVYGNSNIKYARRLLYRFLSDSNGIKLRLIEGIGIFNRGKALDIGIRNFEHDALVFFCDPEMIVKPAFIQHCQRNAVKGKQIYYPEYFQLYNQKYSYKKYPRTTTIHRSIGFWATYSYNMVCLYTSDYILIGGLDHAIAEWTKEANVLVNLLAINNMTLFRAPEPALFREYQHVKCSDKMSAEHNCICNEQSLGDRAELAEQVFYQEEKCGIKHWRLWEF